jgi:hypothetical protein
MCLSIDVWMPAKICLYTYYICTSCNTFLKFPVLSSLTKVKCKSNWYTVFSFHISYFHCRVPEKEWSFQDGGRASLFKVGLVVWMKFCRLLCIIASIEYIRRQLEESFISCIKGLIRKLTEIHILTIQSGVNKRNKNRGEHSVIKHPFSIHSYIPVIKKYHGNQM